MKKTIRGISAALFLLAIGCGGGGDDDGGGNGQTLFIGEVVARDASGTALRLGETVTTEGVANADAGLFANNKVRQFIQDSSDGVMVFNASSAQVPTFFAGDRLRVTGTVGQRDPSTEDNQIEGTVLVDTTSGSVEILDSGNPVPDPIEVTTAELVTNGTSYVSSLVRVVGVRKLAGDWPERGARSSELTISDDDGANQVLMRLQRNTIDDELVEKGTLIGDDPFDLVGIVVQDDGTDDGDLLDGFEIWPRGGADLTVR